MGDKNQSDGKNKYEKQIYQIRQIKIYQHISNKYDKHK